MAIENNQEKIKNPFSQWPWVSLSLLIIMAFVFQIERRAANVGLLGYVFDDYGFQWDSFCRNPLISIPRLFSHVFFHADLNHLVSNGIFFMLFAPSIEKKVGVFTFSLLFFGAGAAAALTQGYFSPFSNGLIGASGAISGVAGAFFVLYPLKTPPSFFGLAFGSWVGKIPAFFWIGLWFLDQLRRGFLFLLPETLMGEVSLIGYWAHIGGFAAGALLISPFIFKREFMGSEK